jgi:hypothetical protein
MASAVSPKSLCIPIRVTQPGDPQVAPGSVQVRPLSLGELTFTTVATGCIKGRSDPRGQPTNGQALATAHL